MNRNILKPKKKQSQKRKTGSFLRYCFLVFVLLTGLVVVNDYVIYLDLRRTLCEKGMNAEAQALLSEPRHLTSTIVAYVDAVLNGSEDPCKQTHFPDTGLFAEYPPTVYDEGDGIPQRPEGTIAYVVTITRCPELYAPTVDDTPDPGTELYEVTAIIKNEICNTTEIIQNLNKAISDTESGSTLVRGQTLYSIVNPNGVTCSVPGSTSKYDRVAMLKDMGYRVEIAGQPITNDMLSKTQPYINDHIESDVGIRDTTKLHAWKMVEHPVAIIYNYDVIFKYKVADITTSLESNPDLKGYYVRKAACDDGGNSVVDTGFMVIKPSLEEFDNIVSTYLNTPYDPELGWNSAGHNKCDGKLGLPGFLSYYFSITPGYEELDRCTYSFVADVECINQKVQEDATKTLEIANSILKPTDDPTTPEGTVAYAAVQELEEDVMVDEVRLMEVDEAHPEVSAIIVEEESVTILEVYTMVTLSVMMMVKTTNAQGEITYSMVMSNNYTTELSMIEQISTDPSLIQEPEIVEDPVAGALVGAAVTSPIIARQSTDICGHPHDCPPDDPSWTRSQQLACQELHSNHLMDRRRTELSLDKIELSDLIGQFKPESFHGYCTGPGHANFIGMMDTEVLTAPSWQVMCEPMTCPYGSYLTTQCTCSVVDDPCSACPTGTRCQTSPTLMCIDCKCGMCGRYNDACCQSGTNECAVGNGSSECSLENIFFATIVGNGSVCTNDINMGVSSIPPGCGCIPNRAAPCSYDPGLQQSDLSCFICSAKDLADGVCPRCNQCLSESNTCINDSHTEEDYKTCLSLMGETERSKCSDSCSKW